MRKTPIGHHLSYNTKTQTVDIEPIYDDEYFKIPVSPNKIQLTGGYITWLIIVAFIAGLFLGIIWGAELSKHGLTIPWRWY